MHLSFSNPLWFLGALALAPLLAHLFSRARPQRRPFPSLRLLQEAMRHVTRLRRPRDGWLLLLRTLGMAALTLAFLQPWLLSPLAKGRGATTTALLVIDATASMGYADGTRTRLAQATAVAEDVLATLPTHSKANIVWLRAHSESALPEPGTNLEYLRQALRQAEILPEPGDVAGALALALHQLSTADGERELVVISDFQATTWKGADWAVPQSVRLTRIPIGKERAANTSIAGLALEPPHPIAGQPAQISARVRNFSAEPKRVDVFFQAGESRLSTSVEVAPWGESLAIAPVQFPTEGSAPLEASITEDRFPSDDVRYSLAEIRGALRVGVAGAADDATARVWLRAARALDGVSVQAIPLEQLEKAGRYDVLFVAGWDGRAPETLRAQLHRDGALVIQPAPGLDPAPVRAALDLPAAAGDASPFALESHDAPGWSTHLASEDHPIFALFADGAFGDPVSGRFRQRLPFPAFLTGQTLLAYDDRQPALTLLARPSEHPAPAAWWNLDLGASDWPAKTAFVPFFGEFLRYLAQRSGASALHEIPPGERLRFDTGGAIEPSEIRLVDSKDRPVAFGPESPAAPQRLASKAVAIPGRYRWLSQNTVLEETYVNFPESESDLRQLGLSEIERSGGAVIANVSRLTDLREGKPLWPWCIAAAALMFLLEGLSLWLLPAKIEAAGETAAPAVNHRKEVALL